MSLAEFAVAAASAAAPWVFLHLLEIHKKEKEKKFEDMIHRARHYARLEGKRPEEIDKIEAKLRKEKEGMT